MKKSKRRISTDNVGRLCKSGAVITANITAKRLTTPVGFLDYAPNNPDELKTNRRFEQYDNFGPTSGWSLLELKHTKFKKNSENSKKIGGGGGGGNRSKSIFREIDKRYFGNLLKLPKLVIIDDFTKKLTKQLYHNNNNNNNKKQNSIDFNCYKKQINDEIIKIDKLINSSIVIRESLIIRRMSSTTSNSKNRKRQIIDDNNDNNDNIDGNNKENVPIKFPFIPSTNWVYQTPPNRKLNFNNFAKQQQQNQQQLDLLNDGCSIQPAVLHTNNDKTIVYEMNKFVNVDLTNYQNRQEIDIDRRYMTEITNLQQFGEQHDDNKSTVFRFNANNGGNIDQLDIPTTDPYELEHHFLSLTCRPKKTISTVSRLQNIKRKRDMFSSTTTTTTTPLSPRKQTKFHENLPMMTNNNDREFESSFSLINQSNTDCIEESFTFKFTTTPTTSGRLNGNHYNNNIAGRLFDSKGNEKDSFTFQCDME